MAKIEQKVEQQDSNVDISALVAEVRALREENQAIRKEMNEGKENIFKTWKERYEWPRHYSYKMWWWVPVLNYTSFRKDPTKDFEYKNPINQQWVHNHYLILELANWEKPEVEVTEFNKSSVLSDKVPCNVVSNGSTVTWYEFDTDDFGKFIVTAKTIN